MEKLKPTLSVVRSLDERVATLEAALGQQARLIAQLSGLIERQADMVRDMAERMMPGDDAA